MTLQQLIYFQKIATLQHYNKAAKELHVAQPSLSKSMALLEEELRVPLFEKQGRNIILTKYGQVFLEYTNKILDEIDAAKNHMNGMLDNHVGHINIAYISPFGHNYIPKMVRKFLSQKNNENITFSFKEGFTGSMIKALHNNDIDVVFGSYEENEPDLEFFQIIRENLILIAPPNFEIEKGRCYSLSDFTGTPFIAYDRISNMGIYTRKIFYDQELRMNFLCESSDELAILALVSSEFGISYVAETKEVKEAIEKGAVKQIPIKEEHYRTLHMIYAKNKFFAPVVLDFIEFVKEEYTIL